MTVRNYVAFENGQYVRRPSNLDTADFLSLRVGTDTLEIKETTGNFDFSAVRLTNAAAAVGANDLTTLSQVSTLISNQSSSLTWLNAVITRSTTPPTTPATGARYLIKATGTGAWAGKEDQVAQWSGTAWVYTLPVIGDFVAVDDEPTVLYMYGGSSWIARSFESNTASGGLKIVNGDIQVKLEAVNPTLSLDGASALQVKLDPAAGLQTGAAGVGTKLNGSTLAVSSSGLSVAAAGITATQLAASVAGSGLTGGAGAAISVVTGDGIQLTASSAVAADFRLSFQNDNVGSLIAGQIAYVKPTGHVDLASSTTASTTADVVVVSDPTIASGAVGLCYARVGALIGGYSTLIIGALVFVSKSTAGGVTQDVSAFTTGDNVYQIGRAISATQIKYSPRHVIIL